MRKWQRNTDFETKASEPAVMSAIVITKCNRKEQGLDDFRIGGRTDTKTGTKSLSRKG